MRIACIYLPSFPLQAHIRQAPHLASAPLAVADGAATGSMIMACSRAAWSQGIRPGTAVSMARLIAPDLNIVINAPTLYERALDALADSLLGMCDTVDIKSASGAFGPHRAIYVSVPPRTRGASFGQKLLAQISRQGFRGRVGVADDRFTAYVAAVTMDGRGDARLDTPRAKPPMFHQSCTSVPRGGSAAFLAPLPLGYLPIDPDVQRMLQTCGVNTLGDFAALPPPSVSRPWVDVDFQALARGAGSARLSGVSRDAVLERPVVERVELEAGDLATALPVALRTACDRASLRLEGRERGATALRVRLLSMAEPPAEPLAEVDVADLHPTSSSRDLLEAVTGRLDTLAAQPGQRNDWYAMGHAVLAVELTVVAESETMASALELFTARAGATPHAAAHAAAGAAPNAAPNAALNALADTTTGSAGNAPADASANASESAADEHLVRAATPAGSPGARPAPKHMTHRQQRAPRRRVQPGRPVQQHLFDC